MHYWPDFQVQAITQTLRFDRLLCFKDDYKKHLELKQQQNKEDNRIFAGTTKRKKKSNNKKPGRKKKYHITDVDIYKDSFTEAQPMKMTHED